MATDTKNLSRLQSNRGSSIESGQEENLIQRVNIRTMRKDLKQLRESDALRESEKIIKIKAPSSKPTQTSAVINQEVKKEEFPPIKVVPPLPPENITKKPAAYNIDTVSEDDEKKLFNAPFLQKSIDVKEPQIEGLETKELQVKQPSETLSEKFAEADNTITENKKYAIEE